MNISIEDKKQLQQIMGYPVEEVLDKTLWRGVEAMMKRNICLYTIRLYLMIRNR